MRFCLRSSQKNGIIGITNIFKEAGCVNIYVDPDYADFQRCLQQDIYVDKSMIIECINKYINTEDRFINISMPLRFGKSMTANMLTAYYSRGCDSREMFSDLKIAKSADFEKHLNKYNVIHINMVNFLSESKDMNELIDFVSEDITEEILTEFSDVKFPKRQTLVRLLQSVFVQTKIPFVFIIDEWDCIFRIHKNDSDAQTKYLDFLRNLLKDQSYVALAYMTGILPIKKYGEHSALNMFTEVSMTNPREYAEYTGFTEEEVKELCQKYDMPFDETKRWYDGYDLKGIATYNPRSVVMSMTGHDFDSYCTSTETYEALKVYIDMNFDGLKDKVTRLVAGEKIPINPTKFQNDMTTLRSADDIFTLLVHLGYLTFDFYTKCVWIPNSEVAQEFINSIEDGSWEDVMKAINASDKLLQATINGDEQAVTELIDKAHSENTSILKYNDENSLSCVISIAYYSTKRTYTVERELPAGKGYADLVFKPRRNNANPAMIVELKYNKSAESAIQQIKDKNYPDCLKDYSGEVLLVGISYDDEKRHCCRIEKIVM